MMSLDLSPWALSVSIGSQDKLRYTSELGEKIFLFPSWFFDISFVIFNEVITLIKL